MHMIGRFNGFFVLLARSIKTWAIPDPSEFEIPSISSIIKKFGLQSPKTERISIAFWIFGLNFDAVLSSLALISIELYPECLASIWANVVFPIPGEPCSRRIFLIGRESLSFLVFPFEKTTWSHFFIHLRTSLFVLCFTISYKVDKSKKILTSWLNKSLNFFGAYLSTQSCDKKLFFFLGEIGIGLNSL